MRFIGEASEQLHVVEQARAPVPRSVSSTPGMRNSARWPVADVLSHPAGCCRARRNQQCLVVSDLHETSSPPAARRRSGSLRRRLQNDEGRGAMKRRQCLSNLRVASDRAPLRRRVALRNLSRLSIMSWHHNFIRTADHAVQARSPARVARARTTGLGAGRRPRPRLGHHHVVMPSPIARSAPLPRRAAAPSGGISRPWLRRRRCR